MQLGVGDFKVEQTDRDYVNEVLNTGRLSYGPFTKKFEQEFARLHHVKYAIFCNSGTSALQVALHALKLKYGYQDGDEVIVPALTFVATVNIVIQNGMKPVLVDVDPMYYELNENLIEKAITSRTRAIIPVHVGGLPCNMTKIMEIANKHKLQVIEDSCETMFAKQSGKRVGSFGNMGCFSTYVAHILTTGVGGFVTTNDEELARSCKSLFNHGRNNIYMSIDDDKGKTQNELKEIVSKRFQFENVGYSYRATEFEGAIGLAQIERYKKNIEARKNNAAYLYEGLKDLPLGLPNERIDTDHVYMFYPLVAEDRNELCQYLEEHGIETRYLLPLTNQPVYKDIFNEEDYPVAKMLNEHAFYIASHPGLTKDNLDYIIRIFRRFYE